MELRRITDTDSPLWDQAWELYQASFPAAERRTLASHRAAMEDKDFYFHLLTEDDRLIGLLSWWDWEREEVRYRFGEHFAIRGDIRGGGYGSRALEYLKQQDRLLMLEIDPPADDISRRREGFYERNGFVSNPEYDHVHPSFREETEPHDLLLMSFPRALTPGEFEAFSEFNRTRVLKYTERKR